MPPGGHSRPTRTPGVRWREDHEPMPVSETAAWAMRNAEIAAGVLDASSCDDVTAAQLGEACAEAGHGADPIGRGLGLLRELGARGFLITKAKD